MDRRTVLLGFLTLPWAVKEVLGNDYIPPQLASVPKAPSVSSRAAVRISFERYAVKELEAKARAEGEKFLNHSTTVVTYQPQHRKMRRAVMAGKYALVLPSFPVVGWMGYDLRNAGRTNQHWARKKYGFTYQLDPLVCDPNPLEKGEWIDEKGWIWVVEKFRVRYHYECGNPYAAVCVRIRVKDRLEHAPPLPPPPDCPELPVPVPNITYVEQPPIVVPPRPVVKKAPVYVTELGQGERTASIILGPETSANLAFLHWDDRDINIRNSNQTAVTVNNKFEVPVTVKCPEGVDVPPTIPPPPGQPPIDTPPNNPEDSSPHGGGPIPGANPGEAAGPGNGGTPGYLPTDR